MLRLKKPDARRLLRVACGCICLGISCLAAADDIPRGNPTSLLDQGFSGLYNLDFAGAQKDFARWQGQHPDNPVGPVSEAAGLLFPSSIVWACWKRSFTKKTQLSRRARK